MLSLNYAWNELRRRWGRTLVTALGLAAGVGLVMGIIGVSDGLSDAQNTVLSPLSTVGTDIIVTRTVAPTTSTSTTTTTLPGGGANANGGPGGGGGGGGAFFGRSAGLGSSLSSLNSQDASDLYNANSSVITDLAKLGKPGTQFTHDFFVPGTLLTFPSQAVAVVSKISGVTSAVGALSLQALHESGTVPTIVASVKTGGQTLKENITPPKLTAAQSAAERSCIQAAVQKEFGGAVNTFRTQNSGTAGASSGTSGPTPTRGRGTGGGSGGGTFTFKGLASNPAIQNCLTPAQKSYQQNVIVPEQTINQVLNPPTTNTATSSYTVAGVDPSNPNSGLVTKAQLVSGTWFTSNPTDEVLVNTAYASTKKLKVGGTITINSTTYHIVGLVNPTLTGDVSDLYFDLATLQSQSTNSSRVNEVLVSVAKSSEVNTVAAEIKKELPGAQVLTSKSLADQVSGSLANAHKLANDLGGALAIVVLLAAFLIAILLTLSSIAKRVREIGSLRAIGWSRGRVVRQIVTEMLGIGVVGALIGIGVGAAVCGVIGAIGPGLSVTSSGLAVGASSAGNIFHQATSASVTKTIHLTAPIHFTTILLGAAGAIVGGLIAGGIGGWRAARLVPATALRDIG